MGFVPSYDISFFRLRQGDSAFLSTKCDPLLKKEKLPHRWGALRKEVSVFEGKFSEMLRRQSLTVGRLPAACGFAFAKNLHF
jgi:hypothetical protein